MPVLPFYQYQQKNHKEFQIKGFPQYNKDSNRNSCKSKSKEPQCRKGSASNSIETPKDLSRTKSKSNLVPLNFPNNSKKQTPQISKVQNNKIERPKSSQVVLRKAQSTKNIHERKPLEERKDLIQNEQKRMSKDNRRESIRKQSLKKQPGVKNMFKKVMQTKKMIKIHK